MLQNRALTEEQTTLRTHFVAFFEDDLFRDKYERRVHDMMRSGKNRLLVDLSDMDDHVVEGDQGRLGRGISNDPATYIPLCELAVHDIVIRKQPEYLKVDYRARHVHVGFEGPVGQILSPRDLYARSLNRLVAVEGIITRQSALRPRILETVHFCPRTGRFSRKEYRDQLSPMIDSAHLPTVNVMPLTDMEGNPLRTELGLSSFVDSQCCILQETPESAPAGQLPRSVELRLDDDLVDSVKPGDRIVAVGMYRPYTSNGNAGSNSAVAGTNGSSGGFQTILLVNHVHHPQASVKVPRLFPALEDEIRKFTLRHQARCPDGVLQVLAQSVAPTIYGLTAEKKAVLLLMAGGVERIAHHSHIRGDINVLLVGEPSTAKSQLLRFVLGVVPHALSTTGKGSSGVGLTAAVTVDQYSNERSLSAGAMVLADRGILCVDEFDKMTPGDRVAMHEAMEQQTVTIAKAGINASLNARCSVLAAANPAYGSYSTKHSLEWNVGLPESLLSRFDLTFIILDKHSAQHNRRTGSHILQNHMRAEAVPFHAQSVTTVVGGAGEEANNINGGGAGAGAGAGNNGGATTAEREQENAALVAQVRAIAAQPSDQVVPLHFLRRYLQIARGHSPLLTEQSQRLVAENFATIRSEQAQRGGGFAVTYRTLDSMIRLATAHAKLRLSEVVCEEDVAVATQLVRGSALITQGANVTRDAAEDELQMQQQQKGLLMTPAQLAEEQARLFGSVNAIGPIAAAAATSAQRDEAQRGDDDDDTENEDPFAFRHKHQQQKQQRFPQKARRVDETDFEGGVIEDDPFAAAAATTASSSAAQQQPQQPGARGLLDITEIRPALAEIMSRLRREQRGDVAIAELRDRLQQRLQVQNLTPAAVESAVMELNPEEYVFGADTDGVVFLI